MLEIRDTDYWLRCNEIATVRQVGPRNDTMLRVPTDYWLLCNEIATARLVGPRNDKTKSLEFVEFIEFVGFIEIGDTDYWLPCNEIASAGFASLATTVVESANPLKPFEEYKCVKI